jgi:hypothetical protein
LATPLTAGDLAAIAHLIGTVTTARDLDDEPRWRACWSSEPHLVIDVAGEPLKEYVGSEGLEERSGERRSGQLQFHHLGLVSIIDSGESWAEATTTGQLIRLVDNSPRLAAFAHYNDRVVRENGVWLLQSRIIRVWSTTNLSD